jgi:uncharacterized protein YjiK
MNKKYLYILFIVFLSCSGNKNENKSPLGYDLNQPETFNMPEALNEISGISFYKGNSDTLYAEQDEEGKLFYLHLGDKKASHVKFGKKGDYEDLAIINEQVIMLRSDGTLFSFPFKEVQQEEVTDVKEWAGLLPDGEFEGLYADAKNNLLYVLCKHCGDDETTKAITAYILKLQSDGSITQSGSASVNVKVIEELAGEKKLKFHPSALAKNPQTQQWYILSAVNEMLIVADNDWKVKEVYRLDAGTFRQPEGIAFDGENNLYISNEGDDISKGNVLKFVFKKTN